MSLPQNLSTLCQRWRLEALAELTEVMALLMSADFHQADYCDRISGLADHAQLTTDRITPRSIWDSRLTILGSSESKIQNPKSKISRRQHQPGGLRAMTPDPPIQSLVRHPENRGKPAR